MVFVRELAASATAYLRVAASPHGFRGGGTSRDGGSACEALPLDTDHSNRGQAGVAGSLPLKAQLTITGSIARTMNRQVAKASHIWNGGWPRSNSLFVVSCFVVPAWPNRFLLGCCRYAQDLRAPVSEDLQVCSLYAEPHEAYVLVLGLP